MGLHMTKVAVVLSGCGHLDGAEIRESVLTLFYLDREGATVQCFAPDIPQRDVINHLDAGPMAESRNVRVEAARIARGDVRPLSEADAAGFDALILPGGFGAAKNLSDFALKGKDCTVLPELARLIRDFHAAGKPIGAICIAPALLAASLSGITAPVLTIGDDRHIASILESWGARHRNCASQECVVDARNRLATCSAYMRNDSLNNIAQGIEKTIRAVMQMTHEQKSKAA